MKALLQAGPSRRWPHGPKSDFLSVVNLRGLSAAAIGKTFVCHIALDTNGDAAKAVKLLKRM